MATTPVNHLHSTRERLNERTRRFATSYSRQISDRQRNLADLKRRFRPDRFLDRIGEEQRCLCDWQNRYFQRFKDGIQFRRHQLGHYRSRFRLETFITMIRIERARLGTMAGTIRAADPTTSLKRGFSLVYAGDGNLVKSISQVQTADIISTQVGDGRVISTVNRTERKQDG